MNQTNCSIVIPAYNEAKRLPLTLARVLAFIERTGWDAEIIVVNDGSTDATADVVRGYAAQFPSVRLIDNIVNHGKGKSIRDGVLKADREIILFTDADNSTPIEYAENLVQYIRNGADIVIGSRWIDPKLQTSPQPLHRRLNGRLYNLLLRTILGLDFKDTQNGFKAFTRRAAKTIFALQKVGGWGFDAEILYQAKLHNFTVKEVPVEYIYYAEGSKINPYRDGARMFLELLLVRWYALTGGYSTRTLGAVPVQEGQFSK